MYALIQSIARSMSHPDYSSLLPATESISKFFCELSLIVALDTVVQEVMSQLRWNLMGKMATEVFLTLARLMAMCSLRNVHCALTIAIRITDTVSYFVQCFAPAEVQLAVLCNAQTLKVCQSLGSDEQAIDALVNLSDVRYYYRDFEGLFYVNFTLGLAHYHRWKSLESESESKAAQLHFQRALNCTSRAQEIRCFPTDLVPGDLCKLFLSDLLIVGPTIVTSPYHSWKLGENPFLSRYNATDLFLVEDLRTYEISPALSFAPNDTTLTHFFRSAAGSQQVLFLHDFSCMYGLSR